MGPGRVACWGENESKILLGCGERIGGFHQGGLRWARGTGAC